MQAVLGGGLDGEDLQLAVLILADQRALRTDLVAAERAKVELELAVAALGVEIDLVLELLDGFCRSLGAFAAWPVPKVLTDGVVQLVEQGGAVLHPVFEICTRRRGRCRVGGLRPHKSREGGNQEQHEHRRTNL